jgi:hypothetical protein
MEVEVAQRVTVTLEDDPGGGPADETVRFTFGGTEYEIDLSAKNATAFRKKLAPFIEHARKARPRRPRQPGGTAASRQRSGDIRAWANAQSIAGQWTRAHPRQRDGAIPGRHHTALTPVVMGLGAWPDARAPRPTRCPAGSTCWACWAVGLPAPAGKGVRLAGRAHAGAARSTSTPIICQPASVRLIAGTHSRGSHRRAQTSSRRQNALCAAMTAHAAVVSLRLGCWGGATDQPDHARSRRREPRPHVL